MNKKSLTLLEILIATVILALVVGGLANVFMVGKKYILHSRSRMSAGELAKTFLDPLQMQVREDQWSTNCLGTGTPANCPDQTVGITQGLDRDYTAKYTVTPNSPITNLSKVRIDITWPKATP